jgi:hypothetical protein
MEPMTAAERAVVERLIREVEETIIEVGRVLGPEDPAVVSIRHARDYLRGKRDTRMWTSE